MIFFSIAFLITHSTSPWLIYWKWMCWGKGVLMTFDLSDSKRPQVGLIFRGWWQFALFFLNLILFIFLYRRFLLVIHFIHISVYMSIPISQFITPPPPTPPLFPLGVHTFVLYICVSISALQTGSSVPFF